MLLPEQARRELVQALAPNMGIYGATFTEVMFTDLIPMIESQFRGISSREQRAMAGLSMGGMQTFLTTLPHLDRFRCRNH